VERLPLLTLPQVANTVGVEYRTLHSWLQRGLIEPSIQRSRGTGVPHLFNREDVVKAKVITDLRQAGVSFELLAEAASSLDGHPTALVDGAVVLVNGSVSVVDPDRAAAAISGEVLTLVYNVGYAIQLVDDALGAASSEDSAKQPLSTAETARRRVP